MQDTATFAPTDFNQTPIAEELISVDICGKEVLVKAGLGLTETVGFVDSIATMVLDDETGEYRPELFDFAFGAMLLVFFTNIELPADTEEQFELVCYTNMCFEAQKVIDTEYLDGLRDAAQRKIAHLVRCAENTLTAKMADLLASFEQLQECTRDAFSHVGGADLKALVDNLSGMDEATLAKAVLAHQENQSGESHDQ